MNCIFTKQCPFLFTWMENIDMVYSISSLANSQVESCFKRISSVLQVQKGWILAAWEDLQNTFISSKPFPSCIIPLCRSGNDELWNYHFHKRSLKLRIFSWDAYRDFEDKQRVVCQKIREIYRAWCMCVHWAVGDWVRMPGLWRYYVLGESSVIT